jgi:hypothetical protein
METALRVLSDNEIEQVHERTLSLLATTGVRVDTERGRKILKKAGADVDNRTHIVRFPAFPGGGMPAPGPARFHAGRQATGVELTPSTTTSARCWPTGRLST